MITLPIYFGIVVVSSAITFIMAIWLQNRQTQEIVTKIDVQERKRRPLGFKLVAFFFYSYAFNGQTMTNLRLIAVWKSSALWRALALHDSQFHCIIKPGWITILSLHSYGPTKSLDSARQRGQNIGLPLHKIICTLAADECKTIANVCLMPSAARAAPFLLFPTIYCAKTTTVFKIQRVARPRIDFST